jgi:hypothetical protein
MKNLQGKEAVNRMLELMGKQPVNENTKTSVVELTKIGPDGKVYGIVRENHEYYIKVTNPKENLVTEDFQYIGGLQNKKSEAYPSYAKAIKQLNLKFLSLNEAYNKDGRVNVFLDDNLLTEHHTGIKADAALSATKGVGDNEEYIVDKKGDKLSYDTKEGKEEGQFGDNLADGKTVNDFDKVKLSETELAIDSILEGTEDVEAPVAKKGYSISRAIQEMDSIIDSTKEDSRIKSILEGLTAEEMTELANELKKKV